MNPEECPYCRGDIKAYASICQWCNRELTAYWAEKSRKEEKSNAIQGGLILTAGAGGYYIYADDPAWWVLLLVGLGILIFFSAFSKS